MKKAASVGWITMLALAALFPVVSPAQEWDSVTSRVVAPGVVHRRIVVNRGPWRMNVLEVDLRHAGIGIRGMRANDSFLGRETVRSMAGRYKGPGEVVAAVNADFFNVRTGESENNVLIEGTMSKGVTVSDSPYDRFNTLHSQIGFDWSNHPFIDRFGLSATLRQGRRRIQLDGVNFRPPWPDAVVLHTSFAGDSTPSDTTRRDLAYLPLELVSSIKGEMTFRIAGQLVSGARASLAKGGALAADGERTPELEAIARRGGTIHVSTALAPERGTLRTVVGGWPRIVRDGHSTAEFADVIEGTFPRFSSGRHPRTAAGFSGDSSTLYLVTVDGRRESDSGMSLGELADAMLKIGAYDAMNFDGGGSTTMVVKGQVVNRPSDTAGERPVGSALLVIIDQPPTHR